MRLLLPLAPPTFVARLPGGGTIVLRYREQIGLSTLLNGAFEAAETKELCRLTRLGTMAIDAGANVGLFTIPLATSVGAAGRVLAFEPTAETARRLQENVRRNRLDNVTLVEAALGDRRGHGTLSIHADGAYNSLAPAGSTQRVEIRVDRLDDVWDEAGRPEVSVLKVDVEGAELDVLAGATALLRSARPAVLVEAAEDSRAREVAELLRSYDYVRALPSGFQAWNYLFLPAETPASRTDGRPGRAVA